MMLALLVSAINQTRDMAMGKDKRTHVHYQNAVQQMILSIGYTPETRPARVNHPVSTIAQRYALLRCAYNTAKGMHDDAREQLLSRLIVPPEVGTHILHDDAFVIVQAQVTEPTRKLDEVALIGALVERFDVTHDEAMSFVQTCKVKNAGQQRLSVTLRK